MKLVTYKRMRYNLEFENFCLEMENKLKNKYEDVYLDSDKLRNIYKFGPLDKKVILDLGCGSNFEYLGIKFEPHISRALHEDGIKVIGVDQGDNFQEEFENYKINLFDKDSLSFLPENSIDIACAFALFDSISVFSNYSGEDLFRNILPQLERVVKPEGIFVFESLCSGYRDI